MKGHKRIVKLLLESGVTFFPRGGSYESVLQADAFHGHIDTVEILLDAGADDSTGGHSKDALHTAIEGGHADIVILLLTRGFAHRPCDRLRGREQWPARSSGPRDLLREASPDRVAREDVEYDEGEDLEAVMPLTDLEAIFEADQHPWARDQMAKPNEQKSDSFKYINALDSAVRSGHESVVDLILGQVDALDLGDHPVEKAAVVAVKQGHFSILQLLLKHLATRIPITDCLKSLFEAARLSKTPESLGAEQVFAIASQYCTSIELDKFRAETFTMARRYEASDDLTRGSVAQGIRSACTNGNLDELLTIIGSKHVGQLKPEQLVKELHRCAMCGHSSLFKSLFEFLFNSGCLDDMAKVSDSCLVGAAANGHLDIIKLLISLRETTPFSDMTIRGALVNACGRGHAHVVQYLVRDMSANVNEPAIDCLVGLLAEFPFEVDIWRPSRSSSKDTGSSLPTISPLQAALRGFTPASCGYTRNGNMQRNIKPQPDLNQIVKMLLDLGANANELGGQQMYPIQAAADFCPPSVAKQLIEASVDVNLAVGEDSAIFKAAGRELSSGEVLRKLVDAGAKLPNE
ncbi:hypothetical protein CDV31_008554 [Fusarium ambrosium]|uniref:Uncharacterized protein n=1 Tax=Fusarium ambrosium TaxID=131363 RepID=A0A428U062_9HYPO|nr:hypothetical protein CDV31_008554 [Fusarium ambrosium]